MKRILTFILFTMLAASLSACAPVKKGPVRVKCPACGYEFDVQQ